MRAVVIAIAVGAFSASGCGKILGLHEALAGSECVLSSDCAPDKVCIFAVCSPLCEADKDCPTSRRCLKTANGNACVDSRTAACERTCPNGATCDVEQGVCRNSCTTTTDCLGGQACVADLCRGSDPAHDPPMAGGDAGSSVAGGDGGDQGVIGVVNEHCSPDNAYACAGHAQKGVLSCNPTTHVWTALPACAGKQLCDSTPGPNQGSCQDPGGCAGKLQGDEFCSGAQSMTCGPDLVPNTSVTCANVCIGNGQCTDCMPMSTRCLGNGIQTCQVDGTWGLPIACPQACVGNGECGACTPMAKDCSNNGVEICQVDGTWAAAVPCANQACVAGACTGVCSPNAVQCSGVQPQKCDANGAWQSSGAACAWPTSICNGGVCNLPPSCVGLAATCGPNRNASCCAANLVPGGTYNRSNDATYPATVSDFRLDNFEITVGRFRKFVAAYAPTMSKDGAGKNPNNPSDPGWDATWNSLLPATTADLLAGLKCFAPFQVWTDAPDTNESRPVSCINWYEAFAFCIWDGGRLPTEAEWNYAAAGGSQQRPYPWGTTAPDCTYANYLGAAGGMAACVGTANALTNDVGSESPKGDGRWGQSDLAGNVAEWVEDWNVSPYPNPCTNCFAATMSTYRVVRGGNFDANSSFMLSSARGAYTPQNTAVGINGVRCARNP